MNAGSSSSFMTAMIAVLPCERIALRLSAGRSGSSGTPSGTTTLTVTWALAPLEVPRPADRHVRATPDRIELARPADDLPSGHGGILLPLRPVRS